MAGTQVPPEPQVDKPLPGAFQVTDLAQSLPAPFLRLLVLFAAPIAALKAAIEVLFWKPERRVESYMVIGAWWAFCLGFGYVFTWLVPVLVFLPLLPLDRLRLGKKPAPVHTSPAHPATTESLLVTVGDLNSIDSLIPPSPLPHVSVIYSRFRHLGALRLIRGLIVLWVTWVALGFVFGEQVLLAITGTIVLLLPSPGLAQVLSLLKKSLAVRRCVALAFIVVFGTPEKRDYKLGSPIGWLKSKWYWSKHPAEALAFTEKTAEEEDAEDDARTESRAGNPIYFRFELHENQRWWMGLDWTSALLPQERPSWCDSHLLPVSPPVAFTLPPPSSIDLPAPTKNEPRAQVCRTATWRWLDDDWSVVKSGQGAGMGGGSGGTSKVPTPNPPAAATLPSPADDTDRASIASTDSRAGTARGTSSSRPSSGIFGSSPDDGGHTRSPSMAEQAFAKGLGRIKNLPLGTSTQTPVRQPSVSRGRTGSEASHTESADEIISPVTGEAVTPIAAQDDATDADGWVYGDNKWENMTSKGGLGKFTRRRRWQRRAVCTETVMRIPDLAPLSADLDGDAGSGAVTPVPATAAGGLKAPAVTGTTTTTTSTATGGPSPVKAGPVGITLETKAADARIVAHAPVVAPAPGAGAGSIGMGMGIGSGTSTGVGTSRDEQLRQRLKKAMGSMGA